MTKKQYIFDIGKFHILAWEDGEIIIELPDEEGLAITIKELEEIVQTFKKYRDGIYPRHHE